jgi:hypothetical protein
MCQSVNAVTWQFCSHAICWNLLFGVDGAAWEQHWWLLMEVVGDGDGLAQVSRLLMKRLIGV